MEKLRAGEAMRHFVNKRLVGQSRRRANGDFPVGRGEPSTFASESSNVPSDDFNDGKPFPSTVRFAPRRRGIPEFLMPLAGECGDSGCQASREQSGSGNARHGGGLLDSTQQKW